MSSSNCCFLTCKQVSQEAGQVVWYSHLFQNFPQFIVIHIVKGFGIVNKAEIDVFLELSCFFSDWLLDYIFHTDSAVLLTAWVWMNSSKALIYLSFQIWLMHFLGITYAEFNHYIIKFLSKDFTITNIETTLFSAYRKMWKHKKQSRNVILLKQIISLEEWPQFHIFWGRNNQCLKEPEREDTQSGKKQENAKRLPSHTIQCSLKGREKGKLQHRFPKHQEAGYITQRKTNIALSHL